MSPQKTRRAQLTEDTYQEIKATAFEIMREKGTNSLSVREISRRIGMSASAFYHYFPSLHDLITTLIVDSFKEVAAAVAAARQQAKTGDQNYRDQLLSMAQGFRMWGVNHSDKFQLIYGTPISNYAAPEEVTVPFVQQMSVPVLETLIAGIKSGEIDPPHELRNIPTSINLHYHRRADTEDEVHLLANHILNVIWQSVFGLVMLEINNHLYPTVGDTTTFFDYHLQLQLTLVGVKIR